MTAIRRSRVSRPIIPAVATSSDTDWRQNGLCTKTDPDLFFPVGQGLLAARQAEKAKKVCRRCPVVDQCLSWALETVQEHGVWGGLDEEERRALTGARRRSLRYETSAVQHLLTERRAEWDHFTGQGLDGWELAQALGTNVQTVNRVRAALAASATDGMGLAS